MYFLLALGLFVLIVAATWFMGTWNIFLNLVITIIAASVASSNFEIVAEKIVEQDPSFTYLADFLGLWIAFALTFLVLRIAAELLTRYRMKMNIFVDMAFRTGFAMLTAWIFICFTFFTLHAAPLPLTGNFGAFQETPETRNLGGIGPDRLWMSYVQSRSRGALSEFKDPMLFDADTREDHPDDEGMNCRVFDPEGDFIFKYHHRREVISREETIRVN